MRRGLRSGLRSADIVPTTFNAIPPYRTVDSRSIPFTFGPGTTADWCVLRENGVFTILPPTTRAVSLIVTIADTEGAGFLGVHPAGSPYPGTSTINWWQSGLVLANNAIVAVGVSPTSGPGSVSVYCGGGGRTSVIADVTGYFE